MPELHARARLRAAGGDVQAKLGVAGPTHAALAMQRHSEAHVGVVAPAPPELHVVAVVPVARGDVEAHVGAPREADLPEPVGRQQEGVRLPAVRELNFRGSPRGAAHAQAKARVRRPADVARAARRHDETHVGMAHGGAEDPGELLPPHGGVCTRVLRAGEADIQYAAFQEVTRGLHALAGRRLATERRGVGTHCCCAVCEGEVHFAAQVIGPVLAVPVDAIPVVADVFRPASALALAGTSVPARAVAAPTLALPLVAEVVVAAACERTLLNLHVHTLVDRQVAVMLRIPEATDVGVTSLHEEVGNPKHLGGHAGLDELRCVV
mmetsp:Transcript_55718/g.172717  ORF Transcript_55718/g.172717 Transcript_55718/m.172717 type:complete len:323 (+) Transcript_55718:580-1548(+)